MNRRIRGGRLQRGLVTLMVLVLMALNAAGSLVNAQDNPTTGSVGPRVENASAPDFSLPNLDGAKVSLSQYKGEKPVMLYFWATWCPYCIAVKPQIGKIREAVDAKDLEILGINVGGADSMERLKKYQQAHPVTWPILYDGDQTVSRSYGVQGIPFFVVIDKDGKEVYRSNSLPEEPLTLVQPAGTSGGQRATP